MRKQLASMNINKTTLEQVQGVYPFLPFFVNPFLEFEDLELLELDEALLIPQGLRARQTVLKLEVLKLPKETRLKLPAVVGLQGHHGRRLSLCLSFFPSPLLRRPAAGYVRLATCFCLRLGTYYLPPTSYRSFRHLLLGTCLT